ncbi:MAG: cell wall-binding repeat-containing protein, partial [Coriobacteriia bacterium]|nr:cell wall-binding repeat-containing protein [Coriobacteriia bacterium]
MSLVALKKRQFFRGMMVFLCLAITLSSPWSIQQAAADDGPIVLTISEQYGEDAPVTVKEYTAADLASIVTTYTDSQGYLNFNGGFWRVYAAKNGVTVDSLLSDAGVANWREGSALAFTCSDGPYDSYSPTYEDIHEDRYFYPATEVVATSTAGAVPVDSIISLDWLSAGGVPTGKVAGQVLADAVTKPDKGRFFLGLNEEEYVSGVGEFGKRYVSDVTGITVVSDAPIALTVSEQYGEGAPVTVKEYTAVELASIVTTYTGNKGYFNYSGTWRVYAAKNGVAIDTLLTDAGVTNWDEGSTLALTCSDGPYDSYSPTYEEFHEDRYFYPATEATVTSTVGAIQVDPILSLNWLSVGAIPAGSTAGQTVANAVAKPEVGRLFVGTSEEEYTSGIGKFGGRYASGIVEITVVSDAPVVLTVSEQYGEEEPVTVKEYTATELASITATYENNQGYLNYSVSGGTWRAYAVGSGVSISTLLADAGVTNWDEGSTLAFTCGDGPYGSYSPTYETLNEDRYFYPATERETTSTADAVLVAPAISFDWLGINSIPVGSTAGQVVASAETQPVGSRFFLGLTEEEYLSGSGDFGRRYASDVIEVTVVSGTGGGGDADMPITATIKDKHGKGSHNGDTGFDSTDTGCEAMCHSAKGYTGCMYEGCHRVAEAPDLEAGYTADDAPENHGYIRPDTSGCEACHRVLGGGSIKRIAGDDRFETAIKVSRENFEGADAVIIATGMNYADALSASALAGALRAPLLLTRTEVLSPGVLAEVERLGAKDVYIMGSTAAVSAAVADALAAEGLSVERIGGADRYGTSALIAGKVASLTGPDFAKKAFLARGDNFADGLSASPVAYANRYPVVLTRPTELPASAAGAITSLGIMDVTITGSEAAVSAGVEAAVRALPTGPTVRRLAG